MHPLARYLDNSAFVEGWGIYSESTLASEMGLYASDATWLRELEDRVYGTSSASVALSVCLPLPLVGSEFGRPPGVDAGA